MGGMVRTARVTTIAGAIALAFSFSASGQERQGEREWVKEWKQPPTRDESQEQEQLPMRAQHTQRFSEQVGWGDGDQTRAYEEFRELEQRPRRNEETGYFRKSGEIDGGYRAGGYRADGYRSESRYNWDERDVQEDRSRRSSPY